MHITDRPKSNTLATRASILCVLLFVVFISACSGIKLISDYDEKIDQGVTDIQKKTEAIITKIERSSRDPRASYSAKDYSDIKEDLSVLMTRAGSVEKNELTQKQLYTLGYSLLENPMMAPEDFKVAPPDKANSLEARHKSSEPFGAIDVQNLRTILGSSFRAILKLELAKKRGTSAALDGK